MVGVSEAQVTPGTVGSKTLDGVGNKITSTVTGPSRGLDTNCLNCTGGGVSYLDADTIVNQTTTAVHGQNYMYNGATWDRVRGTIAGGVLVNVSNASLAVTTVDTISTNNSTTATLGIGGVFTGTSDDIQNFKAMSVLIFSDKNSATLGVSFQWSSDNVNWDTIEQYDYLTANGGAPFVLSPRARYFRIVYTNGGVAQTVFRVQTIYRTATVTELHDRVKNIPLANDPTINVHAVIAGETTAGGGAFVNVKVNPSGTLTVAASQDTSPWVVSGTVGVSNAFLLDATLTNRFPAGSTPADNESNAVTISRIGNFNYVFDGAAWDRWTGAVSQSGTWNIGTVTTVTTVGTLTTITNPVTVLGNKTNNNAAPGATNVGVLPCIATAAAPTYVEGNQVGCSTLLTGSTRVDVIAALPTGANVIGALTANQSVNLAQVAGTATVNGGLAGSLAIGGTAANNAAITQNPDLIGAEVITEGTQPTAATTGNQRRLLASTEGSLYVTPYSANRFSCFVQAVTVTTLCQAIPAAGLRNYITSVSISNQAATVQGVDIVFGTGANCVTGITALTHKWQFGTLALTTSPMSVSQTFPTPLRPTAATGVCLRPTAATAFGATITGYIAP